VRQQHHDALNVARQYCSPGITEHVAWTLIPLAAPSAKMVKSTIPHQECW